MPYTDDDLEDQIQEQKLVIDALGMINFEHYLRFKVGAAQGMMQFGDPFFRSLGETLALSDVKNAVKIINVWRQDCTQFEMLHKIQVAKQKAKLEDS